MALCGDAPSGTCGRAVGDTARAQRTQDGAGEDRPQRRARARHAGLLGEQGRLALARQLNGAADPPHGRQG